jgi:hypothetical protein
MLYLMDALSDDLLKHIFSYLDCVSKIRVKSLNTKHNAMVQITREEMLYHVFNDVLTNVGNNYSIATSNRSFLDGMQVSYILNVYTSFAVLFRRVQNTLGGVVYTNICNVPRDSIILSDAYLIVNTLQEYSPIITYDIKETSIVMSLVHLVNSFT